MHDPCSACTLPHRQNTPMNIDHLDHLVLTVANVAATCDFYTRVLGMQVVTFGAGRTALAYGAQKINLHQRGQEFEPKATLPTPGSADLCFITPTPLADVMARLRQCQVEILEGPVQRTGANGPIVSVYFRDPDGNLIEVSNEKPRPEQAAPPDEAEERIVQLEIKLSYAEDLLDTLNDLVAKQQAQMDWLLREVDQLRRREDASGPAFRSLRDELPPHY